LNISDIGTGSGCIGISLATELMKKNINSFDIYLSDISPKALDIAEKNSKTILKENQNSLHFINSNLLEKYPQDIKFDLIIPNLPYIPTNRISELDPSVKDFEPISALDGGDNGTELINNLLKTISPYLEPRFMVILEVDSTHTIDMFNIPKHFSSRIALDSFGQNRFLILTPK
jgi:release factor glutamine methyltransferase